MKNRKSRKVFIFWIYKAQMNVGLTHKKNGPSLIEPNGQKVFKPRYLLYD